MNISVVGLGKLGLCTAACFASQGHQVFGFDSDRNLLKELRAHHCPIDETDLADILEKVWPSFSVCDGIDEAIAFSEVTLIIVPTPSSSKGRFINDFVLEVLRSICPSLQKKNCFHIVGVVSTVMPGASEQEFVPLLESLTGKKCGSDFGFVYNPEFIALGSVVRNFLNPDLVLIGTSDPCSGNTVKSLYESTCLNKPHVSIMNLINAEITKISLNCFVTMKISFANALASICERLPGADIDAVTTAIGADTRLGSKYLKAGLGFGGPCFPRDNLAFQAFADEFGMQASLAKAVVEINNMVTARLFAKVRTFSSDGKVALLGMSYKADTHIIEESQSVLLASRLSEAGYNVTVTDPKALSGIRQVLGDSVKCQNDVYECIRDADIIILLTDWPDYRQIDWAKAADLASTDAALLDSWRIVPEAARQKFRYWAIGIGTGEDANQ